MQIVFEAPFVYVYIKYINTYFLYGQVVVHDYQFIYYKYEESLSYKLRLPLIFHCIIGSPSADVKTLYQESNVRPNGFKYA